MSRILPLQITLIRFVPHLMLPGGSLWASKPNSHSRSTFESDPLSYPRSADCSAIAMSKSPTSNSKPMATGSTIVIKLGTSSILSEKNLQPRLGLLANLVESCVALREIGHKVVLVSSGAIGMGMRRMSLLEVGLEGRWGRKPKSLNEKQALAAVGQGHLIALWDSLFSRLNQPIAQILLTRGDLADRSRYLNASSTLSTLLSCGVIPIINENDTISVSEIKFGDNDTLSAVTAAMCHADFLFLMTDVDCLYTANPRTNPSAKMVRMVYDIEGAREIVSTATLGSSLGTGGMETKLIAAELATAAGVTTIICNGSKPQKVMEIINDLETKPASSPQSTPAVLSSPPTSPGSIDSLAAPIYTAFLPRLTPLTSRKFWVAHGLVPKGAVLIDKGAYEAISDESNGGRLLPAGLVKVYGTFAVAQAILILVPKSYLNPLTSQPASSIDQNQSSKNPLSSNSPLIDSSNVTIDQNSTDQFVSVGRGLVNYNSSDMNKLKGLHSSGIESVLGHIDSEHVVESIVLLKPSPPNQSLFSTEN